MSAPQNAGPHLDPEKSSLSDHGSSVTQFAEIHPGPHASPDHTHTHTHPHHDDHLDSKEVESDFHRDQRINDELTVLARRISNYSHRDNQHDNHDLKPITTKSTIGALAGVNPFEDPSHPELNPSSGEFDPRKWVKLIMRQHARREDEQGVTGTLNFDALHAGVAFKNLNVHGFGRPTDFQKDVANIWFEVVQGVKYIFGKAAKTKIQILRDFEGVVRAGEMLVVLGRPGSGCSTFLKTIAGETHGFFIGEGSDLNYQGITKEVMHKNFRGEVIYQAETDVHFPQLTVGETLEFAAKARAPEIRPFNCTREQYAIHMRDVYMSIFGLSHTLNTQVGNDFIRGVSGGERKRVSIAEVALSGSPLQCWDNSTRGLDSATALEFVKTLRMGSDLQGSTALLAIYQAPQAAYDAFDKVILLYEGRQIYFGRTDEARAYFEKMGYVCPPRSTTADFLTSLTNAAERVVKEGSERLVPRTPDEFAQRWKESEDRKRLLAEIDEFNAEFPLGGPRAQEFREARGALQAKGQRQKSPYTLTVPMQIGLCVDRGFKRLNRDMGLTLTSIIGNTIMALVIGSVFYNLPSDTSSFFSRGALLFFAILMNAFASALEILTLYAQRPIVEKHAKYALYHPFSEAVASMICGLPAKIVSALTFNLTLYFMTNLRREPGPFFIFFLFSFITTLVMSNIFRTIAACSRTLHQAMPFAAIFILALIVYTGFTIPVRDMKSYARWINYLDPIAYAFEALIANEFAGQNYRCAAYLPQNAMGALPMYDIAAESLAHVCTVVGSIPGQEYVEGDRFISQSYNYSKSNMWRNFGILWAFFFFYLALYLGATEYIAAAKSKGEVLVFRKGMVPKSHSGSNDSEGGAAMASEKRPLDNSSPSTEEISASIQKQTAIFHWADVCYDIKIKKEPRRLLDHVDGWVKPGTLTALMGVSGAGKTTLLDVLASRVTMGVVSGNMCVDGHQRDDSFQRKTGYVQQQDLHLSTSTVREGLRFSALLRQPRHLSEQEKLDYVEEIIDLLEMREYADAVVGVPGEGLNVEQRKRLTIGVELTAKPELLLFLDEPTSGLDSQTAWSICRLMRKLANNGQAILCTIHQPSAILFQEFDRLLFLAKGGRPVYFGPIGKNSSTLVSYFERNGSHPCPADGNPAEWMLEVIGAAGGFQAAHDWPEVWNASPEKAAVKQELADMEKNLSQLPPKADPHGSAALTFAAPFSKQLVIVTKRVFEQYWRTPVYIYSKAFLCVATSLFIGFSFFKAGNSLQGLQNQMFSIFMLLTMFGNLAQQMMPHFVTQRALYEVRERPSKTYDWKAFMAANIIVELPWQTLMAVLTFVTWYYPIGLQRNAIPTDAVTERGGLMFLYIWAFYIWSSTFTHAIIAGVETAEAGGNIANLLFSLCLIFCGVLASPDVFPRFWIFIYRLSPFTYLVSGILAVGVANTNVTCSDIEILNFQPLGNQTCGEWMEPWIAAAGGYLQNENAMSDCEFCTVQYTNTFLEQIGSDYSIRWRNWGFLMVYCVFNAFAALGLYWLARVPKGGKVKTEKK